VPPRLAALVLLVMLPACADARAPSDAPTCATEADCAKLYRASLVRLQVCHREMRATGYVGPGGPAKPECTAQQAETAGLASALAKFHDQRKPEGGETQEQGFEVPPLPSTNPGP
jgi:hypothetical protein